MDTARFFIPGWRRPDFPDQDRVGAFFQTKMEMPRFSRPRRRRRDQEKIPRSCDGYGATFHTRVQTASFSRPRRRRQDFPYQGADGIIFQNEVETARPGKCSLRPRWIRRDFSDQSGDCPHQGGYGANFQTKPETAQPRINFSRPRRRRRVFSDQGANGATHQNRAERALLSRPTRRRHDQEKFPRNRCRYGAIFHTRV